MSLLSALDSVPLKIEQLEEQSGEEKDRDRRFKSVEFGPAMLRITSLPRRPSPKVTDPGSKDVAEWLTDRLRKVPRDQLFPGALRPLQGVALQETWQCKGLAAFLRVGYGKMLITYLAPVVHQVGGPILLVTPAQLKGETFAYFKRAFESWKGPQPSEFHHISYEKLSQEAAGEELDAAGNVIRKSFLDRLAPKIVILDEAHKGCSADNVVRRRITAYKDENPDTLIVVTTGTPYNTSIKDAAVLLSWTHGVRSPLPLPKVEYRELEMWSMYLDPTGGEKTGLRIDVGALLGFLSKEEREAYDQELSGKARRKIVRRAIARFVFDTPGVLSAQDGKLRDDNGVEIGLEMETCDPIVESDEVEDFFRCLCGDKLEAQREGRPRAEGEDGQLLYPGWRLPDGTEGDDALWFSAQADKGGLGFWQIMDPPPPLEYIGARNEWAKWVRRLIRCNRRGIDSAARATTAVRKGLYDDEGRLAAWEEAKAAYTRETGLREPPTVPVWLSDEAIRAAEQWVREHNGLIWVRYTCLGARIAEELGIPFYRRGARDEKTKRHITEHKSGAAVVSVQSAKEGKNLQGIWSRNLWMTPPGEQTMARTHRSGQKASSVHNYLYIGCHEHLRTLMNAKDKKADFHGDMMLQLQKIEYAKGELPSLAAIEARQKNRWSRGEMPDDDD